MVVQLSPEIQAAVQQFVDRGDYGDADAVVAEALRLLAERDQFARLKAAIAVGVEQYERGEMMPVTEELFDQLNREAAELARSGAPAKDEVKP